MKTKTSMKNLSLGLLVLMGACGARDEKVIVHVNHDKPTTAPTNGTGPAQAGTNLSDQKGPASNANVKWEDIKTKIIMQNCVGCHGPKNAAGHTDLTDYNNVSKVLGTMFYRAAMTTKEDRMPPPPTPALSLEQKRLLSDWVISGAVQ